MEVEQKLLQRPYFWLMKASWDLDLLDWVIALVLALLVLISISYFAYHRYPRLPVDNSTYTKTSIDHHGMENGRPAGPTCQRIYRDPNRRASFSGNACSVYSWPSSGGVIIKDEVDAVELMFLGLERLNPQMKRDIDPAVEDAFGRELRKIGGKWWRSEQRSLDVTVAQGNGREPTAEERKVQVFGWPSSGGLLVLESESHEEMPEDIGRLTLAFTMEERCQLLEERFHAMVYNDPREYEGLADVWTKDGYEMEAL